MFNRPKIFNGKHAISIKILILLMMKPGTDFLHPEMGIDIVGRYRYCSDDDLDELQEEIDNQLEVYLPGLNIISVNVFFREQDIITKINIDDTIYEFRSDDRTVESLSKLDDNGVLSDGGQTMFEDGAPIEEVDDLIDMFPFFEDLPDPPLDPI